VRHRPRPGRLTLPERKAGPVSDNGREVDPDVLRRLDEVGRALTDLGGLLAQEEEIGRVLQRSVNQVIGAVPGADMASVSVLRGDAAETVASTSERVWAIDSEQYAAGEGPCLEAASTGRFVRVGVTEARERWPAFASSARAAGVESFLSAPLFIDEKFAGSLNLYGEPADSFDDLDETLLRLYTAGAVAAIANARRYAEARRLAENLRRAIESRSVIDQAIGMLMATRRLDAEEAFQMLARESQNTNIKLRDIAARVLDGARRPDSGPGARLRAAAAVPCPASAPRPPIDLAAAPRAIRPPTG
jgi:GAF domain-containing protein